MRKDDKWKKINSQKTKEYIRDGRAPIPKNEVISRKMSAIRGKNTKPELDLRKALWQNNLRGYRLHYKRIPGRPDIVFVKKKLAIFVNGCFWHRCPNCKPNIPKSNLRFWNEKFDKNVKRDIDKTFLLQKNGWHVLTIWECQIKDDLYKQIQKINNLING